MVMKEETGFKQRSQTVGHVPRARFPGSAVLGDRGTMSHFPGQGMGCEWLRPEGIPLQVNELSETRKTPY
jgi:hypothetical protein